MISQRNEIPIKRDVICISFFCFGLQLGRNRPHFEYCYKYSEVL